MAIRRCNITEGIYGDTLEGEGFTAIMDFDSSIPTDRGKAFYSIWGVGVDETTKMVTHVIERVETVRGPDKPGQVRIIEDEHGDIFVATKLSRPARPREFADLHAVIMSAELQEVVSAIAPAMDRRQPPGRSGRG